MEVLRPIKRSFIYARIDHHQQRRNSRQGIFRSAGRHLQGDRRRAWPPGRNCQPQFPIQPCPLHRGRRLLRAFGDMDSRQQNDVTLITESGYLMLVKSFTDDLAWKVQRELVKGYFRAKSSDPQFSTLSPQLQALINIEMRQHEQERQMNELALKVQLNSSTKDKVTAA